MANKIVEKIDYNVDAEFKNSFLNSGMVGSDKAKDLAMSVFKKLDEYEEKVGKSIYLMVVGEIEEFLMSLNLSFSSVQTYFSIITNYVKYVNNSCINSSIITHGLSACKMINAETLKRISNTKSEYNKYITEKEFDEIVLSKKGNAQDRALAILLWYDIKGKDYEDLRNLKEFDVNFINNTIMVNGEKISIKEKHMKVIKEAIIDDEYMMLRGEMQHLPIMKNNHYVIKAVRSNRTTGVDEISSHNIKMRIADFFKYIQIPDITGTSIGISGRVYRLLKDNDFRFMTHNEIMDYCQERGIKSFSTNVCHIEKVMLDKIEKELISEPV